LLKQVEPANTRRQFSLLGLLLVIEACLVFMTYAWFLHSITSSLPATVSTSSPLPAWLLGLASAGFVAVVYGGLGLVGYWSARKLGWPGVFREHAGWHTWLLRPLMVGIILGIAIVLLDRLFVLMDNINDRWRRIILAAQLMKRSEDYSVCGKSQT